MSIWSEIERITQAKDDIKGALEAKGATISAADTIDTYADAISEIPTGGDGRLIIWYTTTDNSLITPDEYAIDKDSNNFIDSIVSNTYSNGQGVIVFKDGVTDIPARAFCRGCGKMTSIRFSKDLKTIGMNYTNQSENSFTFDDDADVSQTNGNLTEIFFEGTTVPEIYGKHNFGCIPWMGECTIYVPAEAYDDYAAADWNTTEVRKITRYADSVEYGTPKAVLSLDEIAEE